ncbi:hypothetical protein F5876DRAFT_68632 [Lentinula aff. lateritia]|uniref:Uncharacterized protein n=1 Tax=Lentinula aff. lateritia TaxID=2804960 RepID=A0ACC1TQ28_9AGAR|nr:hypothetical protein F5876DRAFT_68632 [Lentinula aff. lateritia]
MLLPEELLHLIILAFVGKPSSSSFPTAFERPSVELLALSTVNRQLRRISLPFLVSFVQLKRLKDLENLSQQCLANPLLAKLIKTIQLNGIYFPRKMGHEVLSRVLPRLTRLVCLDLQGSTSSALLLKALYEHSSVSTILVASPYGLYNLPEGPSHLDLSKTVLERADSSHPRLEVWLSRGLHLTKLDVHKPESLQEEFGIRTFRGLQELSLNLNLHPVTLSWLHRFTSGHPNLKLIKFIDQSTMKDYFIRHTVPFVQSFVEKAHQEQLCRAFNLTHIVISRTHRGSLSLDWQVSELTMRVRSSLIEILSLVTLCFPTIHTLGIRAEHCRKRYDIDNLITALARFPLLRVLNLSHLFKRLRSPNEELQRPWKLFRHVDKIHRLKRLGAQAEARLYWYASLIAHGLRSIEALYVEEEGYGDEKSCTNGDWHLAGWLKVDGARNITGILKLDGSPTPGRRTSQFDMRNAVVLQPDSDHKASCSSTITLKAIFFAQSASKAHALSNTSDTIA